MRTARYAVILRLDEATDSKVRALAEKLDPLPRTIASAEVPPHVTLAVCGELDVAAFTPVLGECVKATDALECTLGSLGIFPIPDGVVFLGVAPTPRLVGLHAQVFDRLRDFGVKVEPYWSPDQWVPHCTLATGMPPDIIPVAIRRIAEGFTPISGLFTTMHIVEVESVHVCCEIHLRHPEMDRS